MKIVRIGLGAVLFIGGIVLTLLPGSILFVLAGLVLLSYDWPRAGHVLRYFQNQMSKGARRLDRYLLDRKLRKSRCSR